MKDPEDSSVFLAAMFMMYAESLVTRQSLDVAIGVDIENNYKNKSGKNKMSFLNNIDEYD